MEKFWRMWDCFAIACLLILSITFVGNFLVNYWGHGLPIAMFAFNDYGEALVEAIVFPILIVMAVVTFVRTLKR